jgi:hypothetical protein
VTVDVTGVWKGRAYTPVGGGGGDLEMSLEQRGPRVTGEYRYRGERDFVAPRFGDGMHPTDLWSYCASRREDGWRAAASVSGDPLSGGRATVPGRDREDQPVFAILL